MPFNRRPFSRRALVSAAAGAAVAAGCGPGKRRGSGRRDNILRAPIAQDLISLDPSQFRELTVAEVMFHTFECLTQVDAQGRIAPHLAEKWEISADRRTYTFHLRKGVKFHNGREMTADDVKFSWDRVVSPAAKSLTASTYLKGVTGLAAASSGQATGLSGVKVVDPYTLTVALDQPEAYLPAMLSYPTNVVVCREAIAKTGNMVDATSAVGTGCFRFVSYRPGSQVVMTANRDYWGGAPKVDGIEWPILLDPNTVYQNFVTGAVDIVTNGLAVNQWYQDKLAHRLQKEYATPGTASVDYIVMLKSLVKEFGDVRVRQAISKAIDVPQILHVAYHDFGTIATGILPTALPDIGPLPPAAKYDPAAAQALLAAAGFPGGKGFPQLTMIFFDHSPRMSAVSQMIRANLRDNLGIDVALEPREAGQFFKDADEMKMAFYLTSWIADYPDPQDFLSTLFMTNANLNHYNYSNPQFDALCQRADAEPDTAKRSALYSQANAILTNEVGVMPFAFANRIMLIHQNITGWHANVCFVMPFKDVVKGA